MRADPNLYSNVNAAIQESEQTLQTAMNQLSSGKRVNLPSDDPAAYAADLKSLSNSSTIDSYTKNSDSVLSQAQLADSVLSTVVTSLTRAVSLGTEGGDGTLTDAERSALVQQVQGILSSVVAQANTTSNGKGIFAGTASTATPFVAASNGSDTYTYVGNNGTNSVQVGNALSVTANIPGNAIFNSPGGDVLGSLQQLITALGSGSTADIANATTGISDSISHLGQIRAIYGDTVNQLNAENDYMSQETVSLTSEQNALVGVDLATAATNLTQAQTAQSAVLAMAAKILPTSLLQYLQG